MNMFCFNGSIFYILYAIDICAQFIQMYEQIK